MFSIPLNPKLNQNQFNVLVKFIKDHRELIYDVYFTCRIAPFLQDAMGDLFVNDTGDLIENALILQKETGVQLSATFNNTTVPPTQKNLDTWITQFAPLYGKGIRSATIPHTHWVMTGQIQKAFPELQIKNTILREVNTASDIAKQAEAGFHYINIDRDLMRDRDTLEKIKRVKEKYGIKIALLANEGCLGGCPVMSEHFEFNNNRVAGSQYFTDPISRISCPKWDITDPSTALKTANIPPWREDWVELLEFVDVFKMHGRESVEQTANTISIIDRYKRNQEILFDDFNPYLENTNLQGKPINAWRQFIKNCKFDCWDCNKCDKLYEAKNGAHVDNIEDLIVNGLADSVNEPDLKIYQVPGLTSKRVQRFLNYLTRHVDSYLEVGCYLGATGCAVVKNPVKAYFVDNWAQDVDAYRDDIHLPPNSKEVFIKNIKKHKHEQADIKLFDSHMFDVDVSQIEPVDLFFYDGPHDAEATCRAINYYKDALADQAIIIVDDANFNGVVEGAQKGILDAGLYLRYEKILINDVEDATQWWNGLYIAIIEKRQ